MHLILEGQMDSDSEKHLHLQTAGALSASSILLTMLAGRLGIYVA